MRLILSLLALAVCTGVGADTGVEQLRIAPGLWRVQVSSGTGGGEPQAGFERCVADGSWEEIRRLLVRVDASPGDCPTNAYVRQDRTLNWSLSCVAPPMRGGGSFEIGLEAISGKARIERDRPQSGVLFHSLAASRVGPC